MSEYALLEERLGYRFRDTGLLQQALTHKSFANENPTLSREDNERLEFLGDAVLDLAVGHLLMTEFPVRSEGELSKRRAAIVNEQGLCEVAERLGLGEWLFLGRGEEQTGGRRKSSLLADACEAVLAAVYLDGGFAEAFHVVGALFDARIRGSEKPGGQDYKTQLQEVVQASRRQIPRYQVLGTHGPDHEKIFEVAVEIDGVVMASGSGRSKKEAEQRAAELALAQLAAKSAP